MEELEDLEKEKNRFYELKGSEMKEFKQNVERFAFECQMQVQNLKKGINEVKKEPNQTLQITTLMICKARFWNFKIQGLLRMQFRCLIDEDSYNFNMGFFFGSLSQIQSSFVKFQGSDRCTSDSEIAAAEMRKSELLAMKEELDGKLASNYQIRAQLQKQLQTILTKHKQDTSYKS